MEIPGEQALFRGLKHVDKVLRVAGHEDLDFSVRGKLGVLAEKTAAGKEETLG